MIVIPEQIDVTCSDTDITMTSLPTSKTAPDSDDQTLTPACHSTDAGGATDDTVTTPSAMTSAEPSSHMVSEGEGIQRDQTASDIERRPDCAQTIGFDDVAEEVMIIKRVEHRLRNSQSVGPGMVEDCSKLVSELSRELAVLHGLSQGIGVDTDSHKLRQQLYHCQRRACSLARCNSVSLVPLVRRKTALTTEQVAKVDKLYRIYSGSLEYLLYLLRKMRSLLCHFRLNQDTRLFIRTGITDPTDIPSKPSSSAHRMEECYQHKSADEGSRDDPGKGDSTRMAGDIRTIQQLLCMVTNACDTHPWQVGEEEEQQGEKGGGGGKGEGNEEEGGSQQDFRTRSVLFRLSVKRQSRKSGSRVRKSTEGKQGQVTEPSAAAQPEVTQPPTTVTRKRNHSTTKTKTSRRCCACLVLFGTSGEDDSDDDDDGNGGKEPAEGADTKDPPADAGNPPGDVVHITVTDCAGNVYSPGD